MSLSTNWLFLLCITIDLLAANCSILTGQEKKELNETNEQEIEFPETDWSKLDFRKPHELLKITVIIPENSKGLLHGRLLENGLEEIRFEINDVESLDSITKFLRFRTRLALNDGTGQTSSYSKCGEIMFLLNNKQEFKVTFSDAGFCLEPGYPSSDNIFWCWGLAKIIDDRIRSSTDDAISKEHFAILSGEHLIASQKREFEKLKARLSSHKE
jgi:hypothetical protein